MAQLVKNPPARQETWVWSLGWEDALDKGKAAHSSIPAWRGPWTVGSVVTKSWTQWSDFHSHFVAQHDALELHPAPVCLPLGGSISPCEPTTADLFIHFLKNIWASSNIGKLQVKLTTNEHLQTRVCRNINFHFSMNT